jgi:hypothetical protein
MQADAAPCRDVAPRLPNAAAPSRGGTHAEGVPESALPLPAPWDVAPPYVLPARRGTVAARSSSPARAAPSPVLLLARPLKGAAAHSPTRSPPRPTEPPAGSPAPGRGKPRLRANCKPSSTSFTLPGLYHNSLNRPLDQPSPSSPRTTAAAAATPWPPASLLPAPSPPRPSTQTGPSHSLDPSPAFPRPQAPASSPNSGSPRRPAAPRGYIAKQRNFPGSFLQKGNSNSEVTFLFLVKSV